MDLSELNPEQQEAVTHDQGPLLIVAGAGTGKTRVIANRIAHLISERRVRPDKILALTFTEKAATEMEERVDLLVPYGYTDVWISTFHAFGDRLLRDHALEMGLTPDFRVLTRPEQVIFFKERLFDLPLRYYRPLGDPTRYLEALISLFSRAKDEDVSPEEYQAYARGLAEAAREDHGNLTLAEEAEREAEVSEAYALYQEHMAKAGFLDFGDQVVLALRLLRTHPAILSQVQQQFQYILVDEFQDTNYAQFQLLQLLAGKHRNLAVVGDDDQSIFKFRGAAISNILGFMRMYPDARQVVLTRNYRSTQEILDTAYRLIRRNDPERLEVALQINKRLTTGRDSSEFKENSSEPKSSSEFGVQSSEKEGKGQPIHPFTDSPIHQFTASPLHRPTVQHLHFDTLSSEGDAVAQRIADLHATGRYRYRDFAILVRANSDADPFIRALNMKAIPNRFSGNRGLYGREEVRLLMAFLRTLADMNDSVSLYSLASSEIYQVPAMDLLCCLNLAHRRNVSLHDIFSHQAQIPEMESLSAEARGTLSRLLEDLAEYMTLARDHPTGVVLYQFLTRSGTLQRLSQANTVAADEKVQNMAKFFDVVRSFESMAVLDRVPQFVRHLDLLIQAGDDPATAEADLDADAVHVLTVHKAKGLEFPIVFLVGLVEHKFPSRRRKEPIPLPLNLVKEQVPEGDVHVQEERRLFYVGMTRAQERLYLTSARDYGGAKPRKISPFVMEAMDLPKADVDLQKTSALEAIRHFAPSLNSRDPTVEPLPDDEILNLSHYQIDDFLTCPLKYKYVHVLRVPIRQHHTVIYGKAIHEAVRVYNRARMLGQSITLEDIQGVFERTWVSEGFLSREHEEQRLQAGRKALERFYDSEEAGGQVPTYVEKEFSFLLGMNRLVGRWDRVDHRDGDVVIVDFKSSDVRQAQDAQRKARESLQLSIYALAYRECFGKTPGRLELRFMGTDLVGSVRKKEKDLDKTRALIDQAAAGIRRRDFAPRPTYIACGYCAYRQICPGTAK